MSLSQDVKSNILKGQRNSSNHEREAKRNENVGKFMVGMTVSMCITGILIACSFAAGRMHGRANKYSHDKFMASHEHCDTESVEYNSAHDSPVLVELYCDGVRTVWRR